MITKRNHASIRVNDRWFGDESDVVHELLHLIFQPIVEEHIRQLGELTTERRTEYYERHNHAIEQAVEHLAHVLYDLESKPR